MALSRFQRIHVVGGPGSGKTTLAIRLGDRLGVPAFELDQIAERDGLASDYRPIAPLAQRMLEVSDVAAQPSWVTEGTALWWTRDLFDAADLIVWLDPPWPSSLARIVRRHLGFLCTEVSRQRTWREKLRRLRHPHIAGIVKFSLFALRYYVGNAAKPVQDIDDPRALTRQATARELAPHVPKVIRCTSAADVGRLPSTITDTGVERLLNQDSTDLERGSRSNPA
jgi:cytidylate kinase